MQLEYEMRQFLNTCIAKARAHERQQFAVEVERLRAELTVAHAELAGLREYYHAHREHLIAKQELAEIRRRHAIERAWQAERDPEVPLH